MKKVALLVVSLFALLVVFSFLGFTPSDNISGGAIFYPESSFCATKWRAATGDQPEQQSDCALQALDRKAASYADQDMTQFYNNYFELKPGDNLLVDNTYMFKFFRGFVREWAEDSNNVPNYEAQISVARMRGNFANDIIVRTVKKRDEVVVFDRLNMIMDWVTDIDEQSNVDDRAQFIFPNAVNIVYNPTLKLGDQVLVNGKVVELMGYQKDFEPTADIERGWVDLVIDGFEYQLYSFDQVSNVGGLSISVNSVNTIKGEISLMFMDAKTAKLLE